MIIKASYVMPIASLSLSALISNNREGVAQGIIAYCFLHLHGYRHYYLIRYRVIALVFDIRQTNY